MPSDMSDEEQSDVGDSGDATCAPKRRGSQSPLADIAKRRLLRRLVPIQGPPLTTETAVISTVPDYFGQRYSFDYNMAALPQGVLTFFEESGVMPAVVLETRSPTSLTMVYTVQAEVNGKVSVTLLFTTVQSPNVRKNAADTLELGLIAIAPLPKGEPPPPL